MRMSPTRNESTEIQCFEGGNAIAMHNGIEFDFYTRLPHMYGPLKYIAVEFNEPNIFTDLFMRFSW